MRLLLAVLLSGCTTITPVYVRDGQKAYLVECHERISRCHEAAAETCKGAYVPIDKSASSAPFLVGSSTKQGGTLFGGSARMFELTFQCQ